MLPDNLGIRGPDWDVVGYADITIGKAPSHGKVSSERRQDYPTHTKDKARNDCKRNLAGASELFYQSHAEFHGTDSFSIQVKDLNNQLHSFRKSEIQTLDKQMGASLMPNYTGKVSGAELDDLVAYLRVHWPTHD